MAQDQSLFTFKAKEQLKKEAPLADRMRPESLETFVGQTDVVGANGVLRRIIESGDVPSMIFWGPPGVGKTTLARIIARTTSARFVQLSAVSSGLADLRAAVGEATEFLALNGQRTIIFVDEIHRWNKAQQDAFLPCVEDGTVTLIGATTENPSFEVNSALLSRSRVFVLKRLAEAEIVSLLEQALKDECNGLGKTPISAEDGVLRGIAALADGDARVALNALELAVRCAQESRPVDAADKAVLHLTNELVKRVLSRSHLLYDKNGEEHYNIISALHKSMRGSDADAALYWLGRMLASGEDPLYVARRLVRFASEDIGLADPQALVQATAAFQAAHQLGMPECNVCLAQAVAYMARAPKSRALDDALADINADIAASQNEPVPLHLRNAPTALMKQLGYGKGYSFSPDQQNRADFLPASLRGKTYLNAPRSQRAPRTEEKPPAG